MARARSRGACVAPAVESGASAHGRESRRRHVDRMAEASLDRPNEPLPADTTGAYALLAVLQAEARDAAGAFVTVERRSCARVARALATNERDIAGHDAARTRGGTAARGRGRVHPRASRS